MAIRHYRVTLTTVGPVHIGDGSSYSKNDYFDDHGKVTLLNAARFVSRLDASQLEEYCDYLSQGSDGGLQGFLERHRDMYALARKCELYQTEMKLSRKRNGNPPEYNVAAFVKDAYGLPYVPGSSIKGMLRTALLSYLVSKEREEYEELLHSCADYQGRRSAVCREVEQRALCWERPGVPSRDAVNDIMRFISVSDSEPLATEQLTFVQKYDLFAKTDDALHKRSATRGRQNGGDFKGNKLPIYRECLKPGSRIVFSVDIDEQIDDYLSESLDADGLLSVLRSFDNLYKEYFLECFDVERGGDSSGLSDDGRCSYIYQSGPFEGRRCPNTAIENTGYCRLHQSAAQDAVDAEDAFCYLGGGVGFDSKTVLNAIFKKREQAVQEKARIIYSQFPSKMDKSMHASLWREVSSRGFEPKPMRARRFGNRLVKGKDDHRHWQDEELGVSPHTAKYGIIGDEKYPMGKCSITVEEA